MVNTYIPDECDPLSGELGAELMWWGTVSRGEFGTEQSDLILVTSPSTSENDPFLPPFLRENALDMELRNWKENTNIINCVSY